MIRAILFDAGNTLIRMDYAAIAAELGRHGVSVTPEAVQRAEWTARVQLESRALWEFYHAESIARDVRNEITAAWDEEHMFRCLAWLYDGFALPTEGEQSTRRARAASRH